MPTLNYKTLWYLENNNIRSYGQDGYVPIQIWENGPIWIVAFRNHFSRCREAIYLDGVQSRMPNLRSSFEVVGSRIPANEQTSRSYMDNVAYNCTLSYGTC